MESYPVDIAPSCLRFAAQPMQQSQQSFLVRGELLYRLSLYPGITAATSQLDWLISITAINVVESRERPAQIIWLWHGAPRRFCLQPR
jgi:hypothetical protein